MCFVLVCADLRVGIQYAYASCLDHLMYGVNLNSVEVSIVLSVFKIASILDISLHFAAAGEGVHPTFPFPLFGFSGGIWVDSNVYLHMHFLFPFVSS